VQVGDVSLGSKLALQKLELSLEPSQSFFG